MSEDTAKEAMELLETQTPWVEDKTISEVLRDTTNNFPDNEALVFAHLDYRITYSEFDKEVDNAARGLLALGINKGDNVAMWATNVPEWPILQLAAARIGAVFVTMNPAYRSSELEYALKQSDVKALFLIDSFKSSNYFEILQKICPELAESKPGSLSSSKFPKLEYVVAVRGKPIEGMLSWDDLIERGKGISVDEVKGIEEGLKNNEAINIQYTSGTTGFPKAAALTHRNILFNGYYASGCQNITDKDRMCIPVPYYHCFGCVMGTLGAITRGATMVIPAEYFDPEATLKTIEDEKCTTLYGVPAMFIAMLDHDTFKERKFDSLRSGIMAGAPCPIEVMKKVVDQMNMSEVTIAYGQTETSPVLTQTRVNDPIEARVETVGKEIPGVKIKIVDPETGKELGANEQGELCAKGHGIMLGYYNNEEATDEAIDKDGWIHTGDLAIKRKDGYYKITGRIKDMVIRGGENIYPREIEEFLFTHEAVGQVAIVGVPDKKFGEELCAWVQLNADSKDKVSEDEIKEFCKANIAHYKVPRYVKFVDEFPMTVSGKIQKFKIRDQMIEELGLELQETA